MKFIPLFLTASLLNFGSAGKPQRLNGKVNGQVFFGGSSTPIQLSNNDLHSYVVANDGRVYVAINTIPAALGPSLLPLSSLGGVIGWAFALEQPGFQNGFSIIGGEFTRQAEVTFLPGNEKLTIKQEFKGIDAHGHLVVNTELDGRVPEVPRGSTVQIQPYKEIYQYSGNTITSASTLAYTVTSSDGGAQSRSYQWRQSIVFQSSPHDKASRPPTQDLSVDQIFVMYDPSNQMIRYAMSNKIGSIHGEEPEQNPCFTGRHGCDTNAVCRPGQGIQFTCECATGFSGDGRTCHDIDECRERPQVCGPHVTCNNQPGTYRCECAGGYQFASDGQTCIKDPFVYTTPPEDPIVLTTAPEDLIVHTTPTDSPENREQEAAFEDTKICYILDGILSLYGIIVTVLLFRMKRRPGSNLGHSKEKPEEGIYTGLTPHAQDTYETIRAQKKGMV